MPENTDPSISQHVSHYSTLLSTGREVSLSELVPTFNQLDSILHQHPDDDNLNVNAISYALKRLPAEIVNVSKILLVQSYSDLNSIGFDIQSWKVIESDGRRRLTYLNASGNTMASLISSESDIHDLVNCLISFYIERNKIKNKITGRLKELIDQEKYQILNLDLAQWEKLKTTLGDNWGAVLQSMLSNIEPSIKMYGRNPPLYQANTQVWMDNLMYNSLTLGWQKAPIYLVSSNSHSLVNVIGGFINQRQTYIFDYMSRQHPDIYRQWFDIKNKHGTSRVNDFLYHMAGIYVKEHPEFLAEKLKYDESLGIKNIKSTDAFQSNTQIIPVNTISKPLSPDPNLTIPDKDKLSQSDALIINIQYPLGYAAYFLLNQFFSTFKNFLGLYIIGKAAILTGSVGDILIPTSVYDEVSNSTFTFNNTFSENFNFETYISQIYRNQKAASVLGTYLENKSLIDRYTRDGINIIEMESGPYLRSLTEHFFLKNQPLPVDKLYNLTQIPFDFGIFNYASDNPLVQNLSHEKISLQGVEPTYLASLATLQQIINRETTRLSATSQ